MPNSPEHASVETFAEYLVDDDLETFDHHDLVLLGESTNKRRQVVRSELESYGFKLVKREPEKTVRGFSSNPHDRWYGPGSCRSHGGSGWEQINGFGGQEG
jgi:hypothetical protein